MSIKSIGGNFVKRIRLLVSTFSFLDQYFYWLISLCIYFYPQKLKKQTTQIKTFWFFAGGSSCNSTNSKRLWLCPFAIDI